MMRNERGIEHGRTVACEFAGCTPVEELKEKSVEFEITTRWVGGVYAWEWQAKCKEATGRYASGDRYDSRKEAKVAAERWCDTTAKTARGPETHTYRAKVA